MSETPPRAARPTLAIGEVSRRSGVTVPTIRYYEQRGLVAPLSREAGRRRFAPEAARRLWVITWVRKAGFTLEEIRMLLGRGGPGALSRRALLQGKLADVRRDIRRLQAVEEALAAAVDCDCESLERCGRLPPSTDAQPRRRPR